MHQCVDDCFAQCLYGVVVDVAPAGALDEGPYRHVPDNGRQRVLDDHGDGAVEGAIVEETWAAPRDGVGRHARVDDERDVELGHELLRVYAEGQQARQRGNRAVVVLQGQHVEASQHGRVVVDPGEDSAPPPADASQQCCHGVGAQIIDGSRRDRRAIVLRLAPVGVKEMDLEVAEPSITITGADERAVVLASGFDVAGLETWIELGDLCDHQRVLVDCDQFDVGADRWLHVVRTCGRQIISDLRGVEWDSWGETIALIQPEDDRSPGAVAERAEGLAGALGQAAGCCLDLDVGQVRCVAAQQGYDGPEFRQIHGVRPT